jgi:hypothetical protein
MLNTDQIIALVILVFAITMYIRVELDFKRNIFRIAGHTIATFLLVFLVLYELGVLDLSLAVSWLLFSSVYLLINETIRIYLRKHKMSDILQNHPRLYWLARGKIKTKPN